MHRTFLLCAPLRFCWLHELDQVQWHGVMTESTRGKSARPSQRGGIRCLGRHDFDTPVPVGWNSED